MMLRKQLVIFPLFVGILLAFHMASAVGSETEPPAQSSGAETPQLQDGDGPKHPKAQKSAKKDQSGSAAGSHATPKRPTFVQARPTSGENSFVNWGMKSNFNGSHRAGGAGLGAGVNFHF